MPYSLAIFTPCIGARSETFIQRHLEDLLPRRTVAVAESMNNEGYGGHWAVDCPILQLEGLNGTMRGRARRALRRIGVAVADAATNAVERFLKGHGIQAVMGEYLDFSLPWLPVARRSGVRFFAHAHGYDISRRLLDPRWRRDYLRYNDSEGIIVVSRASRARLVELGIAETRIHVVPCGVNVPPSPRAPRDDEYVRCLAVGRMVPKKGPILTLDAFRRASEACPHIRLDYVGEGELLPAAQQFVRAFSLGDKVTLHRGLSSDEVQRLMQNADLFMQHSITDPDSGDQEGLPVAIIEAMARSIPVVSTRHAGIPEAVTDGVNGYLVDEGDSRAMAEAVVALVRDRGLRERMGEAGWHRVIADFTWDKEREQLLKIMGLGPSGSATRI